MTIAATPAAPAEAPAQTVQTPSVDDAAEGEEKPQITKIQQFRRLLATKRLAQEQRSEDKAAERHTRKRGDPAPVPKEGDADRPKPDKVEAKAEPKEKPEAKAKPSAKDEPSAERDEHGRFLPKDGKPEAKAEPDPKEKPAPAAKPAEKTAEVPDPKPEPAAKAEPAKPPPGPDPETKRLEEKYARLMLDTKRKDEELVSARELVKKAKALEEAREKVKGGEIDEEALELLTGRTYEQLVRAVAKGPDAGGVKFKPKMLLHPALAETKAQMDAELAKIRAHNERIEREGQEALDKTQREETKRSTTEAIARETEQLKSWLNEDAEAEKYPRLHALPNGAARLLQRWYDDWADASGVDDKGAVRWDNAKRPDPEEVAAKMEASLSSEVGSIFASERALRVALQDPKTRELVVKVLGADAAPPSQPKSSPLNRSDKGTQASADGPRTLSNKVTQEARTDASRPLTDEERSAHRVEQLRNWKSRRGQPVR